MPHSFATFRPPSLTFVVSFSCVCVCRVRGRFAALLRVRLATAMREAGSWMDARTLYETALKTLAGQNSHIDVMETCLAFGRAIFSELQTNEHEPAKVREMYGILHPAAWQMTDRSMVVVCCPLRARLHLAVSMIRQAQLQSERLLLAAVPAHLPPPLLPPASKLAIEVPIRSTARSELYVTAG